MPLPFGIGKKPQPIVRSVFPNLPGPWQYLSLFQMFQANQHKFRDLPAYAYPIIAVIIWRTVQREKQVQREAMLDAEREAIRQSQRVYIVRQKRKRFLIV